MSYECVKVENKDGITVLTLNRPEVMNAFNWTMQQDLQEALHDAHEDDAVRVVVLTGAGDRAFSAGLDLKEGIGTWYKPRSDRKMYDVTPLLFSHMKKPVIAAINGAAIGWGLTLTLLCDIRIASENARMSMRFTEVGLIPEAGSPLLLPRIVGMANALDLSLTARIIDASEAYRIGLVNYLVPYEQLMDKALEVAKSIADKSPTAIALARRAFYDCMSMDFEDQQQREKKDFAVCVASDDHRQRREKFKKRKKD